MGQTNKKTFKKKVNEPLMNFSGHEICFAKF